MPTQNQVKAAMLATIAVAEAIRELGRVPSGHLYAQVCSKLDLAGYEAIIRTLINAGIVKQQQHELIWIGGGR